MRYEYEPVNYYRSAHVPLEVQLEWTRRSIEADIRESPDNPALAFNRVERRWQLFNHFYDGGQVVQDGRVWPDYLPSTLSTPWLLARHLEQREVNGSKIAFLLIKGETGG